LRQLAFAGAFLFLPVHRMTLGNDRPSSSLHSAMLAHRGFYEWLTTPGDGAKRWFEEIEAAKTALHRREMAEFDRKSYASTVGMLTSFSLALILIACVVAGVASGTNAVAWVAAAFLVGFIPAQHFGERIVGKRIRETAERISAAAASIPSLIAASIPPSSDTVSADSPEKSP